MRSRSELADYAALKIDYQRIVDVVDFFPRGVQVRRIAMMVHPRSWEIDEHDLDARQVKATRDRLARLESKGFVTIERTSEYGNIYRPVNSPFDMAMWTLEQGREYYSDRYAARSGPDQTATAAYSMVLSVWRNTLVEEAHAGNGLDRISDGEMFAANVATFRLFRDFLRAADRTRGSWYRLAREMVRADRIVAGMRTVADLLGEFYEQWAASAEGTVMYYAELTERDDHDMEWFIAVKSCFGSVGENWFGMPSWPRVVDVFIQRQHRGSGTVEAGDGDDIGGPSSPAAITANGQVLPMSVEELRLGLLDGPDRIDPEILDWCVDRGIGSIRPERE